MDKAHFVFLLIVLLALIIGSTAAVYNLQSNLSETQVRLETAEARLAARPTVTRTPSGPAQAATTDCETLMDRQAIAQQTRTVLTPPAAFAYAKQFDERGTGIVQLERGAYPQFHYHPIGKPGSFIFVRCLFLQVRMPEAPESAPPVVDFMFWSPFSGGYAINGGHNKLAWGENVISILYPDSLVSPEGDIYFAIRNYGEDAISIQEINLTLWLLNADGSYTVIKPESK